MSIEHLSPAQFAEHFKPSEYGATWDHVVHHARLSNCCGVREFDEYGRGLNEALRDSVQERGVEKPVKVTGEYVTDGHHRVAAALATGSLHPIPYKYGQESYRGQVDAARRGEYLG